MHAEANLLNITKKNGSNNENFDLNTQFIFHLFEETEKEMNKTFYEKHNILCNTITSIIAITILIVAINPFTSFISTWIIVLFCVLSFIALLNIGIAYIEYLDRKNKGNIFQKNIYDAFHIHLGDVDITKLDGILTLCEIIKNSEFKDTLKDLDIEPLYKIRAYGKVSDYESQKINDKACDIIKKLLIKLNLITGSDRFRAEIKQTKSLSINDVQEIIKTRQLDTVRGYYFNQKK